MILLIQGIPTEATMIASLVANLRAAYLAAGSPDVTWDGDAVRLSQQFPQWIVKRAEADPTDAPVLQWFQYYYRWLFDIDGYGLGFYLQAIRDTRTVPERFLQGYADIYMPGLVLSDHPELMDNFRKFLVNWQANYAERRGTPEGIRYALCTLFGATPGTTTVTTTGAGIISIVTDMDSTYNDLVRQLCCPVGFIVQFAAP